MKDCCSSKWHIRFPFSCEPQGPFSPRVLQFALETRNSRAHKVGGVLYQGVASDLRGTPLGMREAKAHADNVRTLAGGFECLAGDAVRCVSGLPGAIWVLARAATTLLGSRGCSFGAPRRPHEPIPEPITARRASAVPEDECSCVDFRSQSRRVEPPRFRKMNAHASSDRRGRARRRHVCDLGRLQVPVRSWSRNPSWSTVVNTRNYVI